MDWTENLKRLQMAGNFEESITLLQNELIARPNDPQVHYQLACTHDSHGKGRNAVKHYEPAIVLGLPEADLQEAYLGLGSTYRCLAEYEKSLKVFNGAISQFPEYRVYEQALLFYSDKLNEIFE